MIWISIFQCLPAAVLAYLSFHLMFYPVEEGKKKTKLFYILLITFCIFASIGVSVYQGQQQDQDSEENHRTISRLTSQVGGLTNQVNNLNDRIAQMTDEFSSNSAVEAPLRLAVLNDENNKLNEDVADLQGQHEIINFSNVTLLAMRSQRDFEISNRNAILEDQQQQATIQQRIADIQTQEQTRSNAARAEIDAAQAKERQEDADRIFESKQRELAKQALPVFDYAIGRLNGMLAEFHRETGLKMNTDFPGPIPTIYSSEMVSNGIMVHGTNFICLGTNAAWNFQISFANESLIRWPNEMYSLTGRYFIALHLQSEGTNGESLLSIRPLTRVEDLRAYQGRIMMDGEIFPIPFREILINLTVPNGLNIDESVSATNYESEIDKALIGLLKAQDQQCPLK